MSSFLAAPLQGPVALNLPFTGQSAGTVRRALTSWLQHQQASEASLNDARLVATELVSNAVRHAAPLANDSMLVRWHREHDDLVLSVCDGGGSSDPVLVVANAQAERGRGLAIVDALSQRWWVQRSHGVHTVHVRLPLF
ncbi:ATP-binding protein [Nocardioides marmorisolisilvae]|uniref:ATP-binding protein n=1 Tax=Nocardioides marmorisolisilvae TaxID=1542737 RepID=A0A3N0E0Q2_9ACTN|nr:ATP-binding protein [Nocardioides marmorisolisilvae]RNL81421.1 ATP-binding protein [Nocardioides marmorisolisilvae]